MMPARMGQVEHARAGRVQLKITATPDDFSIELTDDGVGLGGTSRRSGLDNLRQRAEQHGGTTLTLGS